MCIEHWSAELDTSQQNHTAGKLKNEESIVALWKKSEYYVRLPVIPEPAKLKKLTPKKGSPKIAHFQGFLEIVFEQCPQTKSLPRQHPWGIYNVDTLGKISARW
jgi:hypothetical protein